MSLTLNFRGDLQVAQSMQALAPEIRERAIPRALRLAGSEITRRARALAPRDRTADPAGSLRRSIGLFVRGRRRQMRYVVFGARRGYSRPVTRPIIIHGNLRGAATRRADPANYAHLIEFGHFVVVPRRGVSLRKGNAVLASGRSFVAPRPFLRPAMAGSRDAVRRRLIYELTLAQSRFLTARASRRAA